MLLGLLSGDFSLFEKEELHTHPASSKQDVACPWPLACPPYYYN